MSQLLDSPAPAPVPASVAATMQGHHGTVLLRDQYYPGPDGKTYAGVTGMITVVPASDAIGCDVGRSEATWLALIENADRSELVAFPGCVVLAFHYHDQLVLGAGYWNLDVQWNAD